MLKRVAMLWLAMAIVVSGASAYAAAAAKTEKTAKTEKMAKHRHEAEPAACNKLHGRFLPPDQFPTNVVKILRTTNKAQTNSYVPVVFTMHNINPFDVIRMLHRPVQEEEGLIFTFVNADNKSGKVLYCVPAYMIPSLKKLVESLDVPGLTSLGGDAKIYMRLKHRRVDASTDQAFYDTAASYLNTGAILLPDLPNNAFLFIDDPSGGSNLQSLLNSDLDVPTPMVQLLVKIYEIDANNDAKLGLDYEAWKNSEGQNLFSFGANDSYVSAQGASYSTNNGNNNSYRLQMSSEFFDFLQSKGKAQVLNQVKLGALNMRPASIFAGDQVLYYAVSTTTSAPEDLAAGSTLESSSGRTMTGTTKTVDSDGNLVATTTGLALTFTPNIAEKSVTLDMRLRWSDYTSFDSTGYPQINPRSLQTTMRLGVDEEAVIGGIRRQENVKKTEKMPFLGSLPIIGYVFGGETVTNKITDMIVAVKPVGIVDYKLAKTADEVVDQVDPASAVPLPKTTVGYDQWLLDPSMGVGVEPIK